MPISWPAFAGLFMPLDRITFPVEVVSWLMPATWAFVGLQQLMLLQVPAPEVVFVGLGTLAVVLVAASGTLLARQSRTAIRVRSTPGPRGPKVAHCGSRRGKAARKGHVMAIKWGSGDGMRDPLDGPAGETVGEPSSEVPDGTPRPADSLRSAWRRMFEAWDRRHDPED